MNNNVLLEKINYLRNKRDEIIKTLKELDDWKGVKLEVVYNNGKKDILRPFVSRDLLCYYKKGSSRSGYVLDVNPTVTADLVLKIPKKRKSEAGRWRDAWVKVVEKLEKSGLWPDLLRVLKLGLEIGYEKVMQASKEYWKNHGKEAEVIGQIDKRLLNESGSVNTTIVWRMSKLPKVKKMYFGKYRNEYILDRIKMALNEKRKIDFFEPVNYDVSFNYDGKNKAWYSEEYKGMGNGHYYLVLNETHALYWETD